MTDLTAEKWDDELSAVEGLAVVKFWAPWCRTCKAIGPRYEQVAFQHQDEPQVRFYQVNVRLPYFNGFKPFLCPPSADPAHECAPQFKEHGPLCLSQRVMCLPTIHFYMPGIGRVSRCVVDARTVNTKITDELKRFLDGGKLKTLQKLQRGGRESIVRYTDVMGVLTALAAGRDVPSAEEDKVSAARYRALASDDAYMRDLERLFNWLDRDKNGELDADEVQAAISVLSARLAGGSAADGAGVGDASASAAASSAGASSAGASSAAASAALFAELSDVRGGDLLARAALATPTASTLQDSERGPNLDFAGFVRLMTSQAVAEIASAEGQDRLAQAFKTMDTDGNGEISLEEMLSAVNDVCTLLPAGGNQLACGEPSLVMEAFEAFDEDASGAIDYEEFVAMVSGRGTVETTVYDEFEKA